MVIEKDEVTELCMRIISNRRDLLRSLLFEGTNLLHLTKNEGPPFYSFTGLQQYTSRAIR